MDYRYGSHTIFLIEYDFVRVTKYRYQAPSGEVAERARKLVRGTCEAFDQDSERRGEQGSRAYLARGCFCATVAADDGRDDQAVSGSSL